MSAQDYVSFPGLGIDKLNISREVIVINGFPIYWYGLLIGLGLALALIYAFKRAKHFQLDVDRMIDVVMVSTLFAMAGTRLYFIMFDAELRAEFFSNPKVFFDFREGGLAIYGGIIFAFLTAVWMCKVRKVETLALFDLASIGFLIGQGIGRWGNFFNQEAFGGNTTLPWGMTGSIIKSGINGDGYDVNGLVHPTFFYEFLWCLLGFILLHIVSKKAYKFRGQIFSMYLMWYGVGRFMIEGLRTDSLMFHQIRISQLVAIFSVIGGFILFTALKARQNRSPIDLFANVGEGEADGEEALDEGEAGEEKDDLTQEAEVADDADGEVESSTEGETVSDEVELSAEGETVSDEVELSAEEEAGSDEVEEGEIDG